MTTKPDLLYAVLRINRHGKAAPVGLVSMTRTMTLELRVR